MNLYRWKIAGPCLGLFLLINYTLCARVLVVCPTCTVSGIQEAVSIVDSHDTIQVNQGTYPCVNVQLTKPITILSHEQAELDGLNQGHILQVLADSIQIMGLQFIHTGHSHTSDYAAIYLSHASHFHIANNTLINPTFGILVEKSHNGTIQNNVVRGQSKREDDSGNGIHLWHCKQVRIEQNKLSGMRDGIYFEFVDSSQIRLNHSHHNIRYGLHFMFSNHDAYEENVFESNGAGVAVMFSKFIVMRQNQFIHNWGAASYGLLLKEIYDAEVFQNRFYENTTAIYIEGGTRINYFHNTLERNGWAIKVSGGCYANHFQYNTFQGNSFDLSYHGNLNDNQFDHNYWDSYSGYDLNHDQMGDVPHRPVKLFSYVVNQTPETVILLRSLFVQMINFSEQVSPIFTPDNLADHSPLMQPPK